jgi:uroporphyrinogen decarboxylase
MALMDDIRKCVALTRPEHLPIFCISQEFDAGYCGLSYAEYGASAENIIRCQIEAIKSFGWDWALVHIDGVLELEPLGIETASKDDNSPLQVSRTLELSAKTVSRLTVPRMPGTERMRVLLDALSGLRDERGDGTCITGRVGGPFTTLVRLFGIQGVVTALRDQQDVLTEALGFDVDYALVWGRAQLDAGAHAIWIDDIHAASATLPAPLYEQWALQPTKQLCEGLKDAGAQVFLHCGENNMVGLRLQAKACPSALSVGHGIDLTRVKSELGKEVCLMGNIDPIGLLAQSSASLVASETDRLVRLMAGGGMILNSGGLVPRKAKPPNMHTMHDTGRKVWDLAHGRR